MTPTERELLVLTARELAAFSAWDGHPCDGCAELRRLAALVEVQARTALPSTSNTAHDAVTQADLRAVLALVADVAALLAIAAVDADAIAGIQERAWELRDATRRMAAALGEPERAP